MDRSASPQSEGLGKWVKSEGFCGGFQVFFFFFGFDRCCDVLWWLSFFLFFSVLIGVVMFCGGFHFFLFFFGFDRCCDVLWWLSTFFFVFFRF